MSLTFASSICGLVRSVAGLAFTCGVMGCFFLQTVTFAPGRGEHWLFIGCGILLLAGLALRDWFYRIAAVALVICCIFATIDSYKLGIAHQKRQMAKKATSAQSN
jgi:hypothetical protein